MIGWWDILVRIRSSIAFRSQLSLEDRRSVATRKIWLDPWMDEVLRAHAPRIHRIQGELCIAGEERSVHCTGVRSFATSTPGPPVGRPRSRLLIVGAGLDVESLRRGLRSSVRE
jgi:hypothetical protein